MPQATLVYIAEIRSLYVWFKGGSLQYISKRKKKKREEKKDAFSSHKQPSLKFVLLKPKYTHREKGLEKPYYP